MDLRPDDEVTIEPEGSDRIVGHRAAPDLDAALGVFDGLYEPGHLDRLRSEERAFPAATCVCEAALDD